MSEHTEATSRAEAYPPYQLSPEQKRSWVEQVRQERGVQTALAEALFDEHKRKFGSWKTQLSCFFKGEEKGLKAIFAYPGRLATIERELGYPEGKLNDILDRVRGIQRVDPTGTCRLAGFEDFGPVSLGAAFVPPHCKVNYQLWSSSLLKTSTGDLNLAELLDAVVKVRDAPATIAVLGGPGVGKTTTVMAIEAELEARKLRAARVALDHECPEATAADDFFSQTASKRRALLDEVKERNALLVASGPLDARLEGLPKDVVVVVLSPIQSGWAKRFLDHLASVLLEDFSTRLPAEAVQRWLLDAPHTSRYLDRVELIGLLARYAYEGGEIPAALPLLMERLVARWAGTLRRAGEPRGMQVMVELALPEAMATAASKAVTRGDQWWSIVDLSEALWKAAAGKGAFHIDEFEIAGMLTVVETLVDRGILVRDRERIRPSMNLVQIAALGQALTIDFNEELLSRVVLDHRLAASLPIAAELAGDVSPLLAGLERLPLTVRLQTFPAVTMLLAANAKASDTKILNMWFQRCLAWWAATPPPTREMRLTLGGNPSPNKEPVPDALAGGLAPLVVMGWASTQHAGSLSNLEQLPADALNLEERAFLAVMGRAATEESQANALAIGAPFQSEQILDPIRWQDLVLAGRTSGGGGLTQDEFNIWWRTVATQRLLKETDGRERIAGTAKGWRIEWGMHQGASGAAIWKESLLECLNTADPGGPVAFADAIALTTRRGGNVNGDALRAIWEGSIPAVQQELRVAVWPALPDPNDWFINDRFLTWLLDTVLDAEQRLSVWAKWTDSEHQPPWKCFLDAGLPQRNVVDWALKTLPEEHRAVRDIKRLGGDGLAFTYPEPADVPQAAALDHFVAVGDAELLEQLACTSRREWAVAAFERLAEVNPDRHRSLRLRSTCNINAEQRIASLRGETPRQGERETWAEIALACEDMAERLVRLIQVSVASVGEDRWAEAHSVVCALEIGVMERSAGIEALAQQDSEDESSASEDDSDLDPAALFDILALAAPGVLASVGHVLASANATKDPTFGALVQQLFEGPLKSLIHTPGCADVWKLASACMGVEFVKEFVEQHHGDGHTLARLERCKEAGLFIKVVAPAASLNALGGDALKVFERWVNPNRPELVEPVLRSLIGQGLRLETLLLASKLCAADPESAVAWAADAAEKLELEAQSELWESVLPSLSPGPERGRALGHWLALRPFDQSRRD